MTPIFGPLIDQFVGPGFSAGLILLDLREK
jgi:hypothetical protein